MLPTLMAHDILLENVLKQLHAIDGRAIEYLVFNGGRAFWWLCPNFTVIMLHHHHKEGLLFEMNDCNRCPSDNWESSKCHQTLERLSSHPQWNDL